MRFEDLFYGFKKTANSFEIRSVNISNILGSSDFISAPEIWIEDDSVAALEIFTSEESNNTYFTPHE